MLCLWLPRCRQCRNIISIESREEETLHEQLSRFKVLRVGAALTSLQPNLGSLKHHDSQLRVRVDAVFLQLLLHRFVLNVWSMMCWLFSLWLCWKMRFCFCRMQRSGDSDSARTGDLYSGVQRHSHLYNQPKGAHLDRWRQQSSLVSAETWTNSKASYIQWYQQTLWWRSSCSILRQRRRCERGSDHQPGSGWRCCSLLLSECSSNKQCLGVHTVIFTRTKTSLRSERVCRVCELWQQEVRKEELRKTQK